jgi:hypothetical protein
MANSLAKNMKILGDFLMTPPPGGWFERNGSTHVPLSARALTERIFKLIDEELDLKHKLWDAVKDMGIEHFLVEPVLEHWFGAGNPIGIAMKIAKFGIVWPFRWLTFEGQIAMRPAFENNYCPDTDSGAYVEFLIWCYKQDKSWHYRLPVESRR